MSKVKMKCARCGKHFKSTQARQILCTECEARERRERAANRSTPARATQVTAPASAPKIVGPGASILVPGLPQQPAGPAGESSHAPYQAPDARSGDHHHAPGASRAHAHDGDQAGGSEKHISRAPTKGLKQHAARKAPAQPREPRPAAPPFGLTDELRSRIESRYLELAQPVEFDGIRTQIAGELDIPKSAVKRAVQELRKRTQLPSWWELRAYTGTEQDLDRIRAAYQPHLPVPAIGVHKQLAVELGLSPILVYQGIRRIRAEMRLPQYNAPELHAAPNGTSAPAPQPVETPPARISDA